MANKKVTLENFGAELEKIIDEFKEDVNYNLSDLVNETAKKGAQLLRSTSPVDKKAPKSGTYKRGWAVDESGGHKITVNATIYNRSAPNLAHLLENGHALRQGGRSPAKVHIAPVEDTLYKTLKVEDIVK